jgi:hypothetical protein
MNEGEWRRQQEDMRQNAEALEELRKRLEERKPARAPRPWWKFWASKMYRELGRFGLR